MVFRACRQGGHVVSSIKSLDCDSSLPASVELHPSTFGQSTSRSCVLQWAIPGLDQSFHVAISPFRWVEGSHSLLVLGTLGAWVPQPLISFTSQTRFCWREIWVAESRTRLFHSLHMSIFLSDQLRTFGSFTFAIVQSTTWAFRKITASFGKTLEPIRSLRHTDFALITALSQLWWVYA